jgi:hypothetical protein
LSVAVVGSSVTGGCGGSKGWLSTRAS